MPTRPATTMEPLRSNGFPAEPSESFSDPVVGLTNAKPVLVDHALLAADMPWLYPAYESGRHGIGTGRQTAICGPADEDRIEQWLARSAAVVSVSQVRHNGPHEAIPHDGVVRPSHRAVLQGRSCEVDAACPSLGAVAATALPCVRLAVKGAGVPAGSVPGPRNHETGLASLQELLQEHLLERLVSACLAVQGWRGVTTVPYYAIFDAGFDFYRPSGSRTRAGLGVRRAMRRSAASDLPSLGSREQLLVFETELRLRRLGVTSATTMFHLQPEGRDVRLSVRDADGERHLLLDVGVVAADVASDLFGVPEAGWCLEVDRINIQYSSPSNGSLGPLALIDFGQYCIRERFDRDLASMTSDGPFGLGGRMSAASIAFVQPGPLRPNPARWTKRARGRRPMDELLVDDDGKVWQGTYDASILASEVLRGRTTPGEAAAELDRAPMIIPIGAGAG